MQRKPTTVYSSPDGRQIVPSPAKSKTVKPVKAKTAKTWRAK